MELAFATKQLRAVCEKRSIAERTLGPAVAAKLRARLSDIVAEATVARLIVGTLTQLAKPDEMALELCENYQIVFRANHNTNPQCATGVDWKKVSRIQILRIEAKP